MSRLHWSNLSVGDVQPISRDSNSKENLAMLDKMQHGGVDVARTPNIQIDKYFHEILTILLIFILLF